MTSANNQNTKTILVTIWEPLLKSLNDRVKDASCLRRDQLLDIVLKHEADKLIESTIEKNSSHARKLIELSLAKNSSSRKSVNLGLSSETVDAIKKACDKINTPRDAFINRIILLLIAPSDVINLLLFNHDIDYGGLDEWIQDGVIGYGNDQEYFCFRTNIIDTFRAFLSSDPFWLLRATLEVRHNANQEFSTDLHKQFINHNSLQNIHSKTSKFLKTEDAIFLNIWINQTYEKASKLLEKLEQHSIKSTISDEEDQKEKQRLDRFKKLKNEKREKS